MLRDLTRVPNLLSLARLPLAIAFPGAANRPVLAISVLGAAAVTDVLDGWLARRLDMVTDLGAIVDPLADKAFAATVVITLVTRGQLSIWGVVALLTREIFETPLVVWFLVRRRRRVARDEPGAVRANVLGKAATVLQFATVAAAVAIPVALEPMIALAAAAGVAAGIGYWVRELRAPRVTRAAAR